ncbi:hypothetical protein Tco_1471753, partial [Tanacetum coccineum]
LRTVTLLSTSVVRSSRDLSASVEREFVDASVGDSGDQGVASVDGQDIVEPIMPVTDNVEIEIHGPKRSMKKRVTRGNERTPAASHPPKRLRADYGTAGGFATGGKSPSVLNRSVIASPLDEGGDHTDSMTGPSLRTVGPSARLVVLSDSSHHSGAKSADPKVDSFVRSVTLVTTTATTVMTFVSSVLVHLTGRIALSAFLEGRSGSGFAAGSIHVEEATDAGLEEIYVPEWTVTKGFELNDGRFCANMIDHFTPPAFFKTVCEIEHEQLFAEFNVSVARNLSLSSEVRMSSMGSLRGEVAFAKEHNGLLEQECGSLKLKVTSLESIITEKDRELSDLGASSSSLRSQNQSLVNQVHELETSSTDLREKLEMYEGSMKWLEEFQDSLMRPLETRLAEINADFTKCCMCFQESFHPHLLNVVAGRRWLLTHGMKLIMAKCLNSTEYMEALENALGCAIEKGMQEGLAAGIEHGQAGRCLTDLEAYIPSAEDDFNSAVCNLRGLNFPLLQKLSNKKDASTWDVMDLLRLDDAVAEALGMTGLQPDVNQLMVPVHH